MWNTGIKKKKSLQKLCTLLRISEWLKLNRKSEVLAKLQNKENSHLVLDNLRIVTCSDIKLRNKLYAMGRQYRGHTWKKRKRSSLEEL